MSPVKQVVMLSLVGALALGAISELQAAPVRINAAATRAAATLDSVTDVRWGRWGGPGWGWRRPGIVIGGVGVGVVATPYAYGGYVGAYPYGGPYWTGYPGYWGSRSSICWDRGRRGLCPGSGP